MSAGIRVLFVLLFSISSVMTLEKRSDDVNIESLMTLIQQQAANIDQQAAKIDQQAAKIDQQTATIQAIQAQLTSLQNTDQQQSTIISHLSSRLDTRVYFVAHMTKNYVNIGADNSPLKFDAATTNIGGAYNPASGLFTAPVSGVYVFYAQLMNHQNHGWMAWAIDKAGTLLCENHLQYSTDYDKSSCLATAHVQKGEQVFVRRVSGDANDQVLYGTMYCLFAGYVLSVDA